MGGFIEPDGRSGLGCSATVRARLVPFECPGAVREVELVDEEEIDDDTVEVLMRAMEGLEGPPAKAEFATSLAAVDEVVAVDEADEIGLAGDDFDCVGMRNLIGGGR